MRKILSLGLVLVVGCGGETAPTEADATQAVDAQPSDGAASIDATVDPSAPAAGNYCATWARIDGVQDPFPRYYDRAVIVLDAAPAVSWQDSDGEPEVIAAAVLVGACLEAAEFVTADGYSTSDVLRLCWAGGVGSGLLTWHSDGLNDAHWTVRLDPCR